MKPCKKRKRIIFILLAIGICAIEFPGVLFIADRAYPFVLGLPFIYGYVICWWAYLCLILFYAYKTGWGKRRFTWKGID
ncbi:MAG: hypothetical protein RR626_02875 [Anaerovoracaceae bacterium]